MFSGFKNRAPNLIQKPCETKFPSFNYKGQIEENDVLSVAEQAACVWFHRLVSIWFMEVNEVPSDRTVFSRFSPNGFKRK